VGERGERAERNRTSEQRPRPQRSERPQATDNRAYRENRDAAPSDRDRDRSRDRDRDGRQQRPGGRRDGAHSHRRDDGAPSERVHNAPGTSRPGGAIDASEQAKRRAEHASWSIDQYQVPPAADKKRFQDFDLPSEILHAVADLGFQYCTPIQSLSLEHALAGKNVAGRAQTGTGKTAAFLVAILTRYLRTPEARHTQCGCPRALVLAPTRELVIQICKDAEAVGKYCGLRSLAVYGGMDYDRQKREVSDAPVDLMVATPGRLLDFVRSHVVDLSQVDTLVIDEADRMLDMGFIPDVRSIINRLPPKDKRATMLYSATLTDDVMRLASQWMEEPVRAEVESEQVTTKTVKQVVYVVTAREKFTVLYNHIQQFPDSRILIFCNRRNTTEDVAEALSRRGIRCEMLSGDVNQNRRLRVLEDFREGKVRIVVATDVAGRGLHVDDIGFVINFDFPYEPEDYVHRIGRTGRAGASGTAISFADEDESFIIPDIEKYICEELKCTMLQSDDPLLTKLPDIRSAHGAARRPQERTERPVHGDRRVARPSSQQQQNDAATSLAAESAPAQAAPVADAPAAVVREETVAAQEVVAVPPPAVEKPAPEPSPVAEAPVRIAALPEKPAPVLPVVPEQKADIGPKPRTSDAVPLSPASRTPAASSGPAPVASKRPRFSEEWVPGQGGK
jgi:ATP-dependent RNA helicase RhlB